MGYQEGQDATLALRRALDECKKVKARRLELPAEKLYFQPDYAAVSFRLVFHYEYTISFSTISSTQA